MRSSISMGAGQYTIRSTSGEVLLSGIAEISFSRKEEKPFSKLTKEVIFKKKPTNVSYKGYLKEKLEW